MSALAEQGFDSANGARPLKRVIQRKLQNPLATELLKGELAEGAIVRIDYTDGEFTFARVAASDRDEVLHGEVVS